MVADKIAGDREFRQVISRFARQVKKMQPMLNAIQQVTLGAKLVVEIIGFFPGQQFRCGCKLRYRQIAVRFAPLCVIIRLLNHLNVMQPEQFYRIAPWQRITIIFGTQQDRRADSFFQMNGQHTTQHKSITDIIQRQLAFKTKNQLKGALRIERDFCTVTADIQGDKVIQMRQRIIFNQRLQGGIGVFFHRQDGLIQ